MEELERQKEELNISLIRAQMAQPVFTKEEIVKWISRFKYGNINDKAYQREMIDTFLNSVHVYEDKIIFTYNFRDHAETVTLDEIEYVFCSDVNDCPPPNRRNPNFFPCGNEFGFFVFPCMSSRQAGRIAVGMNGKPVSYESGRPLTGNPFPCRGTACFRQMERRRRAWKNDC